MSDLPAPVLALTLATLLLLGSAIDMTRDRTRPLWLRLVLRVVAFAALTWLMQRAVGSPMAPVLPDTSPGLRVWAQLAEIGWWMMGARVGVGLLKLVVVLENRPRETQIISDLLAGAIYTATALGVINFVFEVPIGGLVATSGVVAIVLGLALQSTLSDVFSGIAVGLEHAYKPGDLLWVEGGIEGQVLQINWRSTQIATFQNSIAIVPNSVIAKSRLENRSAPTPIRSVTVAVSLAAAAEPQRCLDALQAAVKACRLPLSDPEPGVFCVGLQGDGVSYEIRFVVAASRDIAAARSEMLAKVHRHLHYAGIGLAISGIAPGPAPRLPGPADLLATSDAFGALSAHDRELLAAHLVAVHHEQGYTLIREGDMPDGLFLLAGGTVELSQGEGTRKRLLLRASPGDSVGMMSLIMGSAAPLTATALTPVSGYGLDNAAFATALRDCPGLAEGLLTQAKRGRDWLRCEAAAHQDDDHTRQPEMLLTRLRMFLKRLDA